MFFIKKCLVLSLVAAMSAAATATVYRPGLVQAKFSSADIGFTSAVQPTLVSNLLTQTEFPHTGDFDRTYGSFMANFSAGSGTKAYENPWSGNSWA